MVIYKPNMLISGIRTYNQVKQLFINKKKVNAKGS